MNTFLPSSYVFNTNNVLTPSKMDINDGSIFLRQYQTPLIVIIFIFTFVMFLLMAIAAIKQMKKTLIAIIFLIGVSVIMYPIAFSKILGKPFDDDCEFRLHENSNLIVKQNENDSPIVGNEKKGYDYKFYVKDATKPDHLIYLGQTKKKEMFLDDKTNTSQLFTNYYYYVQKHHLNDKFAKKLYFVKDSNTTDINGVPQYVLKGDGITLKIKSDKDQTYQIYTAKE